MKRRHVIVVASVVFFSILWFLGVDRSWFVENCHACGYGMSILQYRVFTIPVHERTIHEHVTLLQKVAKDLGAECAHPKLMRWHKYRWWGLCICASPRLSGTDFLSGDNSWYDDVAAAKVREMARANPSLRDEFAERVLRNRDKEFWKALAEQVRTLRAANP
jgi:hypothetical protein